MLSCMVKAVGTNLTDKTGPQINGIICKYPILVMCLFSSYNFRSSLIFQEFVHLGVIFENMMPTDIFYFDYSKKSFQVF